ncbi:hypothetical protein GLOIN_2v436000 [Rhizophagus clarus]|nr:hypothetical protein GLOIN_2v436000 [Rhizophagus clarus]
MKESYEKQISFPKINSAGMEIVLEYTYTGSIKEESLTKDNMVETFYAADYFQLSDLQDFIINTLKNKLNKNNTENYLPELLSKFAEKMPLADNNIFLNLLVEAVAVMSLNTIEFGRLSIAGLQYLLSCTHEKKKPFATPEYEVFRYSAILAAKQVSNDAHKTLMEQLPTLEQMKQVENSIQIKNKDKFINNYQEVAKELKPLVEFINFCRIKGQILVNFIEPLEIIPNEVLLNVYRHKVLLDNSDLSYIRGIPIYSNYVWDESSCGSKLIIEDSGKVVYTSNYLVNSWQNVRAKILLENSGTFEWDVIIEKVCVYAWVGVCSSENLDYENWAGSQTAGWLLGSSGYCYNSNNGVKYCPPFGDGTKITVHLDMNKRTCSYTVNGTKYPEVTAWNNLPSKLYPVVSLIYPGRCRIEPHQY